MFWETPAEWREAQTGLDHHLKIYSGLDEDVRQKAAAIAGKIEAMDPVLEVLCSLTCPECEDPCCARATVRYDFRDLIFLHLIQKGLPMGQPISGGGTGCSCLGENGCELDRMMRPFMCTWYLCPAQVELLRHAEPWRQYGLLERLREIQGDRKELEKGFLKLVAPQNKVFNSTWE